MLRQQTIEAASTFAQKLLDNRVSIDPMPLTALSELQAAVNNVLNAKNVKYENVNDVVYDIQIASEGSYVSNRHGDIDQKAYMTSTHDVVISDYQDKLTSLVTGYIKFAKVVVNETAKDLFTKVTSDLENYKFKEPEDFFNITYYKPADIFSSSLIDSEVLDYRTYDNYVNDYIGTGNLTSDTFDVNTYLLTGVEDLDIGIKNWIAQVGSDLIFGYIVNGRDEYLLDIPDLLNYSLANYLFYRNLTEKADLNIGLSLAQLRTRASNNRNAYGYKLYSALESYRKTIRKKELLTYSSNCKISILPNSSDVYQLTVYEESFQLLAEAGVPIEALFGFIAHEMTPNDLSVDVLQSKKDFYIKKWENLRSIYSIHLNSSKIDIFKTILSNDFYSTLDQMSEEEKTARESIADYKSVVDIKFTEFMSKLESSHLDNVATVCLELIAAVRFYYSNAYEILSNMEKILSIQEDITPDEAALYSVIDLLVDFFVKQLKTNKI